jgi:hypothetical protein
MSLTARADRWTKMAQEVRRKADSRRDPEAKRMRSPAITKKLAALAAENNAGGSRSPPATPPGQYADARELTRCGAVTDSRSFNVPAMSVRSLCPPGSCTARGVWPTNLRPVICFTAETVGGVAMLRTRHGLRCRPRVTASAQVWWPDVPTLGRRSLGCVRLRPTPPATRSPHRPFGFNIRHKSPLI